jgi:hypothetical protein
MLSICFMTVEASVVTRARVCVGIAPYIEAKSASLCSFPKHGLCLYETNLRRYSIKTGLRFGVAWTSFSYDQISYGIHGTV